MLEMPEGHQTGLENEQLESKCQWFTQKGEFQASMSVCLRSLAYQMAPANSLQRLIASRDDGVCLDEGDETTAWRNLFLDSILKTETVKPHFGVIDAMTNSI